MAPSREVVFTTNQVEGAILNGTIVVKTNSVADDGHRDGARAVVVGSLGPIYQVGLPLYGYWVLWDDLEPPVFIQGNRIEVAA